MPARKLLIWDIAPGPDLTAQITAIDYAEADMFDRLLLEDGSGYLLTEDGDFIDLNEYDIGPRLLLPDGASLRIEGGRYLLLE